MTKTTCIKYISASLLILQVVLHKWQKLFCTLLLSLCQKVSSKEKQKRKEKKERKKEAAHIIKKYIFKSKTSEIKSSCHHSGPWKLSYRGDCLKLYCTWRKSSSDSRIHIEPDFSVEYQYSGFRGGFISRLMLEDCMYDSSEYDFWAIQSHMHLYSRQQSKVCLQTYFLDGSEGWGDIATQHRETFIAS